MITQKELKKMNERVRSIYRNTEDEEMSELCEVATKLLNYISDLEEYVDVIDAKVTRLKKKVDKLEEDSDNYKGLDSARQ